MNRVVRKFLRACDLYDSVVDFRKWIAREEARYVDFYRQFVKEGDLCFDVGANVGRRTRTFLKLKARVVAVEPQPHCMKALKNKYTGNRDVILVQKALGEEQGNADMMVCDAHSLSSLSKNWVETVKASGRYSSCTWNRTVTVPVVPLDDLISQYGKPAFMKIDVEGYEYEVVRGLSQPVKVICFELTPEFADSALAVVAHLAGLGSAAFNYCLANRPTKLALPDWVPSEQMCHILESLRDMPTVADVYVRFK